jgi:hypothetical protein
LRSAVVPIGLLMAVFTAVLTFEAYVDASFRPDGEGAPSGSQATVPVGILEGGPYIDTTGGRMVSYDLPLRTVVLTFDDAPIRSGRRRSWRCWLGTV